MVTDVFTLFYFSREPEPEPEPEIPVVKPLEEEEQISSDEEEKTYAYEGDDTKQKYKRMKRMVDSGSVPKEMQTKKWSLGLTCQIENPFVILKRNCGEKIMSCGSAFRQKFQKKKAIDMNAVRDVFGIFFY